jgi:hypothetical protein
VKFKRGTFNVLEDICCYPIVLILEGSGGGINPSVTVAGRWLFDSNIYVSTTDFTTSVRLVLQHRKRYS